MRVLALDIGEKRIGVAASDPAGKVAFPVTVIPAGEVEGMSATFRRVLEDHEPELIVVGLPISLSGEENAQAVRIRGVADKVASATGLPLEFVDERLSSSEAKRVLHQQGVDARHARGKIDMVAASLFLQTYLDADDR